MKINIKRCAFGTVFAVCLVLGGCFGGGGREPYRNSEFTHANMKWHLEKGKTHTSEVMQVFGPPNVASKEGDELEIWVYQKMSTSTVESAFGGGLGLSALVNEVSANVLGGQVAKGAIKGNLGGSSSFQGGRRTSTLSSKTCTMILKFDKEGILIDYSFRTSNF